MSESKNSDPVPLTSPVIVIPRRSSSWLISSMFLVPFLTVAAIPLYKTHSDELSQYLVHALIRLPNTTPRPPTQNDPILSWELVGLTLLEGPEDVAYHSSSKLIYTGCGDGWIKRVTVNKSGVDTVVKKWVDTGGRPLGIAFGRHNEVIVADPEKGLLNVTKRGKVKVLTNGTKDTNFKLIDSVDVAKDGMIYFTEASYKYSLSNFFLDLLEGKPHGRLWSYDPATKRTKLLLRDLYFANGLAVSPNENSVVFCETFKMRCRKYYIRGKKKGRVNDFIGLPGFPDNIRYDGEGHYWIALSLAGSSKSSELAQRYMSLAGKGLGMDARSKIGKPHDEEESKGGVIIVDTEGNPTYHYYGPEMSLISSGVKIGNFVYCGSLFNPYMVRLNNL